MIEKPPCTACLFFKVVLIGCMGTLIGAYLGLEAGKTESELIWPAFAGAMGALLLGRGWIKPAMK